MAVVKAWRAFRPTKEYVAKIAALPYDVYNREEATKIVKENPDSFLAIDRAETAFGGEVGTYDDVVYDKARDLLNEWIQQGKFVQDACDCYYIYEQVMDGRSQKGIVALASIDDYVNGVIKKHENTRADKEVDRIRHVETCGAQTGPIFLAYRGMDELSSIVADKTMQEPEYDFTGDDGIIHRVWMIDEPSVVEKIGKLFESMEAIYIADGHHRCASAVKVGLKKREENPAYDGTEDFNYFLSVLFPAQELAIFDYNRVVADLNGLTKKEFLESVAADFTIEKNPHGAYRPEKKATFGMYLDGEWYKLTAKDVGESLGAVESLDVSVLQDRVLGPILGIQDPKTDKRIDFVGGIRGLSELEKRVEKDMTVAFSMYPTSIFELFDVPDAGLLMPPKSTWFEPKLRSGLFIHKI